MDSWVTGCHRASNFQLLKSLKGSKTLIKTICFAMVPCAPHDKPVAGWASRGRLAGTLSL